MICNCIESFDARVGALLKSPLPVARGDAIKNAVRTGITVNLFISCYFRIRFSEFQDF